MGLAETIASAIESVANAVPECAGIASYSGTRTDGETFTNQIRLAWVPSLDDALIGEANTAANRKFIKAYVSATDWPEVTHPQTGDSFILENGEEYAVTTVESKANSVWVLSAREVAT